MAPVFEYKAKNSKGNIISGTLEGDNSSLIAKELRKKGYYVTNIKEKKAKKDVSDYINLPRRVKINDIAVFSQQFAAMIDAGISLVDALEILRDQIEHPKLKETVIKLQEDVEVGLGLSEAMLKHPKVFPKLYCQMVRAGEVGGVLDQVLVELAAYYEHQDEINSKVKSALYYPVTVLVIAVLVVTFLVTSIVPQFVDIFATSGAVLPLPTRMLMVLSDFVGNYWWIIILSFLLTIFIFYKFIKTNRGKFLLDRLTLKIPVIGKMMRKVFVSRFSNTLKLLLDSGVDLLSSLAIIEEVLGNKVFANTINKAREQIREGVTLYQPLAQSKEFPSMVVQMIRVGEESGSLTGMLKSVTKFYDREVETAIEGAISLIEPLMIVILAVIVGFIVLSIALPMFQMFQHI